MTRLRLHSLFHKDLRTADLHARGAAIEQARADQALERLWRSRVVQNVRQRIAAGRYHPDHQRQS
jgi:hypothetical protein